MPDLINRRAVVIVLAPAAALATWAVARLAGADLVLKSGSTVNAASVFAAAVLAALAGWFVARLLERRTTRPRYWWALLSSTALAVSITGPTWLADGVSAVALIALHLVTGAFVIAGIARTLPDCGCRLDLGQRDPGSNLAR
jgi:ABC-type Co2+ transport system permease subunit